METTQMTINRFSFAELLKTKVVKTGNRGARGSKYDALFEDYRNLAHSETGAYIELSAEPEKYGFVDEFKGQSLSGMAYLEHNLKNLGVQLSRFDDQKWRGTYTMAIVPNPAKEGDFMLIIGKTKLPKEANEAQPAPVQTEQTVPDADVSIEDNGNIDL